MANSFIDMILNSLGTLLTSHGKEKEIQVEIPIGTPKESSPNMDSNGIDWTDATHHITPHFTVGDAITLHSWNRLATEDDGLDDDVKEKLITLCQKMEQVRTHLGFPMNAHCLFRSVKYNEEVLHSLPNDVHSFGCAIDFDCSPNLTIEEIKDKMEPVLEDFGIRMEKGTTSWIHLDLKEPGPSGRYFTA
jgi:hypothetical protein